MGTNPRLSPRKNPRRRVSSVRASRRRSSRRSRRTSRTCQIRPLWTITSPCPSRTSARRCSGGWDGRRVNPWGGITTGWSPPWSSCPGREGSGWARTRRQTRRRTTKSTSNPGRAERRPRRWCSRRVPRASRGTSRPWTRSCSSWRSPARGKGRGCASSREGTAG